MEHPSWWFTALKENKKGVILVIRKMEESWPGVILPLLMLLRRIKSYYTRPIGHLHNGVILLLRPEFFSFFFSHLKLVAPVRFK